MAGVVGSTYGGTPSVHLGLDKTLGVFYQLTLNSMITREITPRKPEEMTLQEEMTTQNAPVRAFVLDKFGSGR